MGGDAIDDLGGALGEVHSDVGGEGGLIVLDDEHGVRAAFDQMVG
jgi:hypothetical protein